MKLTLSEADKNDSSPPPLYDILSNTVKRSSKERRYPTPIEASHHVLLPASPSTLATAEQPEPRIDWEGRR